MDNRSRARDGNAHGVLGSSLIPRLSLAVCFVAFNLGPQIAMNAVASSRPADQLDLYSSVSVGSLGRLCAILVNGHLICSGFNEDNLAIAPAGEFTSVSLGETSGCAVAVSANLVCWGDDQYGVDDPPPGRYKQVAVSWQYACGLRMSGHIVCWGRQIYGNLDAPGGVFTQITVLNAGIGGGCGLRPSGTMSCWGLGSKAARQPGRFASIATTGLGSCDIRLNGTLACGGKPVKGLTGHFESLTVSGSPDCAIRVSGAVVCWDWAPPPGRTPSGRFLSVSTTPGLACGIRELGQLVCWATPQFPPTIVPGEKWIQASGDLALRADGFVVCWDGCLPGTPSGVRFSSISDYCGISRKETLLCWYGQGDNLVPTGRFTSVSNAYGGDYVTMSRAGCAIRAVSGSLACWGDLTGTPTGPFTSVSVGIAGVGQSFGLGNYACGIRKNETLACWGDPNGRDGSPTGQTSPPAGQFKQVGASYEAACALGVNGHIACWGVGVKTPAGYITSVDVEVGAADPTNPGVGVCGIRVGGRVTCTNGAVGGRFASLDPLGTCGITTIGALDCGLYYLPPAP